MEEENSDNSEQGLGWIPPKDFLEPQFYPDPVLFRASLENQARADHELMKNLTSNKATIRVLAPYLKIMRKEKKRIIETVIKKKDEKSKQSKVFFDKKLKENLIGEIQGLEEKMELVLSIHETADVLKSLLNANYTVSYLVNLATNELYQIWHVVSSTSNLTWKIELGTTMAAHAAFTKNYVVTDNISCDDRFPLGLGFPESMIKYALCVPVKTPDDRVVAVYELVRDAFQVAFDKRDIQIVLAIAGWMGVAILQNSLYSSVAKQQELKNYLLQLSNHYHSGKITAEKTLSDLTIFARETIGSERASVFVVEKVSKGTAVLQEYNQGIDYSRGLFKRRTKRSVKKDGSFLSKVVFNKEVLDVTTDIQDVTASDGENILVRSVLCAPILCNNETLGAIQLTNKKWAARFSQNDKDVLQTFADFCALNLNLLKFHESHNKLQLQHKITREMLFHHIKPCSHDEEASKKPSTHLPEDVFTLSWYPSPDKVPRLVEYTINLFQEVLGGTFMQLNNVPKFVSTVKNCYRPNPYHNFLHAFCVTHAMANIIHGNHSFFTGVERTGLMVAALCHDVDHRGYNNNFIQLTRHYLSSLYDVSPLENHHFAVTKIILEQCNMFQYMKTALHDELLAEIYECIIATDLSLYFQGKMELKRIADEKTFSFKDVTHRRLVKSLMMTACDLSGQTKPLPICQKITEDVYEEFYLQGDVEKRMGYLPLPTMDREKKDMIAENQIQFLSVVVLPCVETVSRIFGNLSPMVKDCKTLVNQWRELIEMKDQDTWKPEESVISNKP